MDVTEEQRLDRLERIVKLMINAGLRARRQAREQDEKINILIDLQIKNEELFAKNEERFAKNEERFARNEERFIKNEGRFARNEKELAAIARKNEEMLAALSAKTEEKFAALAEAQRSLAHTVERIMAERGNGKP